MSAEELMHMMSSSQTREKIFTQIDSSLLLLEAQRLKVSQKNWDELSDFFDLAWKMRDHPTYKYLQVFQRMTLTSNELQLLSIGPDEVDEFGDSAISQIHHLYTEIKCKPLSQVVREIRCAL